MAADANAGDKNELKLVVRGLPFEATEDLVLNHFRIRGDQLNLPVWSDSGRCKGIAFVTCESETQKTSILQMDGTTFTADENTRDLSIKEFEERPRKQGARTRGGNTRSRRGGGRPSAGRGRGDGAQSYVSDGETSREIYISNASFSSTKESFKAFFKDLGDIGEVESITIPTQYQSGKPKGFAFVRFTTVAARDAALKKNGEELDGRALGIRENKGRAERQQNNYRDRQQRRQELSDKPQGCTTIFVGNLPWSTDEAELKKLFEQCGEVVNARIVRQSWTSRSRGFGYVEFAQEASVDTAVQKQITLDGRELRLDYAENLVN